MKDVRDFLTLANLITSLNLAAGFFALVSLIHAHVLLAALLVALAAVFDSVDGTVARRRGSAGDFGTQLDSLADLISFGLVPAVGLYVGPLHALPGVGLAAGLAVVLAAAWRLARFPLVKQRLYFLGLPVPVAGVCLMIVLVCHPGFGVTTIAAVAASVLMVSSMPFPTLHGLARATSKVVRGESRGRVRN